MDSNNASHGAPDGLESQLRKMIIDNGVPPAYNQANQGTQVRTPHAAPGRPNTWQRLPPQRQRQPPFPHYHQQPGQSLNHNAIPAAHRPQHPQHPQRPQHPTQPSPYPYAHPTYLGMRNWNLQADYLDSVAHAEVGKVQIHPSEVQEKEEFRVHLERIIQDAIAQEGPNDLVTVKLVGFGSLASGFATRGSDMDLVLVPVWKDPINMSNANVSKELPRLIEKALLNSNMGARLLTRTRVPILKICQHPSPELYQALSDERGKWDELPEEEKWDKPATSADAKLPIDPPGLNGTTVDDQNNPIHSDHEPSATAADPKTLSAAVPVSGKLPSEQQADPSGAADPKASENKPAEVEDKTPQENAPKSRPKTWLRVKARGPLDFPSSGVGIQCDINFANALGIQNTHLLRCYSLCDKRVQPMVLFVKAWAKRRKINNSYSGTLSSYGWTLMVLHYLVNIAFPPVCPNLQLPWRPSSHVDKLEGLFEARHIDGWEVRFWDNADEILAAGQAGQLTRNNWSVGRLLEGFFKYYAAPAHWDLPGGHKPFHWMQEVISLRTPQGILRKQEKGWTGAKNTQVAGNEVRQRYLLAIEDPFELSHNVGRTVTYNGLTAIRDEFRRAHAILGFVKKGQDPGMGLFDEVIEPSE